MEIYQFKKEAGKKITKFNSDFIMSRITQTQKVAHIGCMHLDKNGVIGYHQAVVPQLLLIVSGEGLVNGLTAIVIESEELNISSFMPLQQ
ncbi:cupin [Virgibacillus doumboii]|uniref:cupin n=1 Tax=Virgibacillus doumboii TaxID=2697503 RepID=UPI0013E02200|nr:cupin [Virgibacillus doumboii]